MCNETKFPDVLVTLTQEYIAPLTSREIKLFVSAEAQEREANQSFQLKCFIATSASSALALTALVIAMTDPAAAAGVISATSSVVALTSFGLYANNRWGFGALMSHEDTQEAQP